MVIKNGDKKASTKTTAKIKIKSTTKSSNKLQQISESPSLNDSNCFFGIKNYIKDFYAQKDDSDQESIIGGSKNKKNKNQYSSSESETESDDESSKHYNIIKNCDKLKKKSRKKVKRLINYSRDHWNLFNDCSENERDNKNKRRKSKRNLDEECQQYKSNEKTCSVYVWRSVFIIGCILLLSGLFMATSFLVTGKLKKKIFNLNFKI